MFLEQLNKVVQEKALPLEVAEKYLNLYIGEADWKTHISKLWTNFENKNKNSDLSKDEIKRAIACTVLLPTIEKTNIPDPVHLILFWCPTWNQYKEKDWFSLLSDVIKKDLMIQKNHNELLSLGVIDPIDYSPLTRQSFNWLYTQAEQNGDITDKNKSVVIKKMQNLVRIYGGAVISNIFTNHKYVLDKVFNWRSAYFFEREIYNIYSYDQIVKIKKTEIEKLNPKYVKSLVLNK
jgi:hypothetical protein